MSGGDPGPPGLEAHQHSPGQCLQGILGTLTQDLGCFLQFFLTNKYLKIEAAGGQLEPFKNFTTSDAHFLLEAKPPQCH